MNKRAVGLLLLAVALALAGCGQKAVKSGSLDDIYRDMQRDNVLPAMIDVAADTALDFYGIDRSDYDEAVMRVAKDSLRADEVLLFRAKNARSAAQIREMLDRRMTAKGDEAKNYSPEQYAIILRGVVLENGLSLALIVSPSVDRLVAVYGQYAAK